MSTNSLIRIRPGRIEAAAAVALYGVYEIVRGFGGENWGAARLHTADIVAVDGAPQSKIGRERRENSRFIAVDMTHFPPRSFT